MAKQKQLILQEEKHAIAEFLAKKEEEQRYTKMYAKMMDDVVEVLKRAKDKDRQEWIAAMQ